MAHGAPNHLQKKAKGCRRPVKHDALNRRQVEPFGEQIHIAQNGGLSRFEAFECLTTKVWMRVAIDMFGCDAGRVELLSEM